jgi:hypothetical protein
VHASVRYYITVTTIVWLLSCKTDSPGVRDSSNAEATATDVSNRPASAGDVEKPRAGAAASGDTHTGPKSQEKCEELKPKWLPLTKRRAVLIEGAGTRRLYHDLYGCPGGPVTEPFPALGYWRINHSKSIVDATQTTAAMLDEEPIYETSSVRSVGDEEHTFVVRCRNRRTEAYIITGDYVRGKQSLTYRIDTREPQKMRASSAVDGKALFFLEPVPLLRNMFGGETFALRYEGSRGAQREALFDVSGIDTAMVEIRKDCERHGAATPAKKCDPETLQWPAVCPPPSTPVDAWQ